MKYLVLVSHGEFADGLHSALDMLAGKKEEVLSVGLKNGLSADEFGEIFKETIAPITSNDEIVLLADIIGGSPLTTALNVLNEKNFMANTIVIGGMNLPLALTSALMKDTLEGDLFVSTVLSEAKTALAEFKLNQENEDEDDI